MLKQGVSVNGTIGTFSYGDVRMISSYCTALQEVWNWCGPGAAYNAVNGVRSQAFLASSLGVGPSGGTPFPGNWTATLNEWRHGNNYTVTQASSYSSSDWRSKLKDSIIYTIDKGYPVIADCYINNDSNRIHSAYWYATDTYHYVVVVGYDDLPSTIPAKVCIVDSNQRIPDRIYWTTLDKLSAATKPLGIVW